ncbi:MAG: hypothetical protein HC913_08815 [Microscillaceae bacterium]|nr:hypothetical protein [Microscillaceae bacterium]
MAHSGRGRDECRFGYSDLQGENGTWGRVAAEFNLPVTDIMTPAFIAQNPVAMWQRFSRGQAQLRHVFPHEGYAILREWAVRKDYFVITSNVDRQFVRAGFAENRLFEIHGAGGFLQCTTPCWPKVWAMDYAIYHETALHPQNLPSCPNCGQLVRPNVLIFQDNTFVRTRIEEQKMNLDAFMARQQKPFLVIEIGAGLAIKTLRRWTDRMVAKYQAQALRINPHDADIAPPGISLPLRAEDAWKNRLFQENLMAYFKLVLPD